MKFGKYMQYHASAFPEYRDYFIDYKSLKRQIKRIKKAYKKRTDSDIHIERNESEPFLPSNRLEQQEQRQRTLYDTTSNSFSNLNIESTVNQNNEQDAQVSGIHEDNNNNSWLSFLFSPDSNDLNKNNNNSNNNQSNNYEEEEEESIHDDDDDPHIHIETSTNGYLSLGNQYEDEDDIALRYINYPSNRNSINTNNQPFIRHHQQQYQHQQQQQQQQQHHRHRHHQDMNLSLNSERESQERFNRDRTGNNDNGDNDDDSDDDSDDILSFDEEKERFMVLLRSEMDKANDFFLFKLDHYNDELQSLENKLSITRLTSRSATSATRKKLSHVYSMLEWLKSYSSINKLAVHKIMKKYDKTAHVSVQAKFFEQVKRTEPFCNVNKLESILEHAQLLYARLFTEGDTSKALGLLRASSIPFSHSDTFKLAFQMGIVLPMVLALILMAPMPPDVTQQKDFLEVFPVFRGFGLFIFYIWLWGINLYIYTRNRINHVFLLNFDPRKNLSWVQCFKTASLVTAIWVVCFLLYLGDYKGVLKLLPIDRHWYPFAMAIALLVIALLPFHLFHLSARWTLLTTLFHLVVVPIGKIRFREFFAADQLTSMVIPLGDLQYIVCYYVSGDWLRTDFSKPAKCAQVDTYLGPLIKVFPYVCRWIQCVRKYFETRDKLHLVNAGKYTSAILVTTFSTIHKITDNQGKFDWDAWRILWITFAPLSTLYAFTWDTTMDWGLLRRRAKRFLLRPQLLYKWHWVYYLAAGFNFMARFAWVATISSSQLLLRLDFEQIIFGAIEMTRRSNWNIFRMENEVLSNVENYRSDKVVPPPVSNLKRSDSEATTSTATLEQESPSPVPSKRNLA